MRRVMFLIFTFYILSGLAFSKDKPIELKLSSWVPPKSIVGQIIDEWIKAVEQSTQGQVKIMHYAGATLGAFADHYNMVLTRQADIVLSGGHATVLLRYNVSALPFLYKSAEQASYVHWQLMEKYMKNTDLKNVKALFVISTPPDQLLTNRRLVKSLKDLKGMKLATGQDIGLETLKALGATPTFIPAPDMYTALERGVIDGLATNWEKAFVFKEFQVTKYRTEAFLWSNPMPVFMSLEVWNGLPESVKKAIDEVSGLGYSRKAGAKFDEAERKARAKIEEEDAKKKRDKIYTLPKEEMDRWIETAKGVHEKWVKDCQAKGIKEAPAILQDAHQLAAAFEKTK